MDARVYLSQEWGQGAPKMCHVEWENRFTLGLNTAKNTDYIERWFKRKLRKIKFPTKN